MAQDDIQGTVTDSAGDPVQGAVVALIPNDGSDGDDVIYTTTDSNGDYIFDGHPQGDGTTQEWHVMARYDDGSGQFNTLSLPYVSADLPEGGTIPDSGVSYWNFEQDMTDSWDGNDGTLTGGTYTTTAQRGDYALSLDGTDDYGEVPHDTSLVPQSWSVAVWAYPESPEQFRGIVDKAIDDQSTTEDSRWRLQYNSDATEVNFNIRDTSSSSYVAVSAPLDSNVYQHFVATYDASSGEMEIYKDGSSQQTNSFSESNLADSTGPLFIGTTAEIQKDKDRYYSGYIDALKFYNKSLSDTEVSNLYNTGSIDG